MSTETLIRADNLNVKFAKHTAIKDISLSIRAGEIVTIIGPNGAGKSTLARCLLGLQQPSSGSVTKNENLRIGYMPQKLHIDPSLPLTVERFIRLCGATITAAVSALEQCQITHLRHAQMHQLSGGETQRALLARALVREPQLLVLDEPEQGMDVTGQSSLYHLIGELRHKLNCAVLLISHELHLVMAATDTVICLNQHICCHGHPDQIQTNPAYLELFGSSADSGLALYTHHHDHTHDAGCAHDDRHEASHLCSSQDEHLPPDVSQTDEEQH